MSASPVWNGGLRRPPAARGGRLLRSVKCQEEQVVAVAPLELELELELEGAAEELRLDPLSGGRQGGAGQGRPGQGRAGRKLSA